ncbi:MAG: histidine phosphatase family protein [Saprospiraceae bacterium]
MVNNKTIYIIRHGETDLNRQGIVQGSGVDAPLNELGRQQAQAFYDLYKVVPFEVVLTSALQRTHQTVAPFLETGLPWEQFADINEMNWGEHEGKVSTPEMHADYQQIKEAWSRGELEVRLPGGESAEELGIRISRFIDHLKHRAEKLILVCSHGRAMSAMMCLLHGLPLHEMNQYFHYNTGLWKVHFDGFAFEFELENDTKHLEPIEQIR